MQQATINGVTLAYEVRGRGEPVLLIPTGPIADSFRPLLDEARLAERYRLIAYHQRGHGDSEHVRPPVSFAVHAADAAALLRHLGVSRAHVAGHSSGAITALQLTLDHPDVVHSLALLEPPLLSVPSAPAFFEQAGPIIADYQAGRAEEAISAFISLVGGREWSECRTLIEAATPGGTARLLRDAANFFEAILPALTEYKFGPEQAASISQPVLSVIGDQTARLFAESHEMLRSWFPKLVVCRVEGAGHLLHFQYTGAVVEGLAEFFARHPMS